MSIRLYFMQAQGKSRRRNFGSSKKKTAKTVNVYNFGILCFRFYSCFEESSVFERQYTTGRALKNKRWNLSQINNITSEKKLWSPKNSQYSREHYVSSQCKWHKQNEPVIINFPEDRIPIPHQIFATSLK